MKKIVFSILATIAGLVLLFTYRTSLDQPTASPIISGTKITPTAGGSPSETPSASPTPTASAAPPVAPSAPPSTGDSSGSSSASSGSSGGGQSGSGLKNGTYTGRTSDTRYGPMQVRITVSNGIIARVAVPRYPDSSGTDQQINSYAIPRLAHETLTAQSARIDMVSGATYTSRGYLDSLQSAIDQARA